MKHLSTAWKPSAACYSQLGCRCDQCRAAKVIANRAWRLKANPPKPQVPRLSRAEHARLYRAAIKKCAFEYGTHYRRVTILTKYTERAQA